MPVLIVFLLLPIAELAALIVVAGWIGWLWALALLALCSVVGSWQLKVQGIGAWRRVRDDLRNSQVPAATMLDGALRVLGAILLTVPGLITAVCSLPLLIGPLRRPIGRAVAAMPSKRLKAPFLVVSTVNDTYTTVRGRRAAGDVVDVEGWESTTPTRPTGELPGPDARDR